MSEWIAIVKRSVRELYPEVPTDPKVKEEDVYEFRKGFVVYVACEEYEVLQNIQGEEAQKFSAFCEARRKKFWKKPQKRNYLKNAQEEKN